ncbi:MAG: hypothetical protein ACK55Z_07315, partial [bacterium]
RLQETASHASAAGASCLQRAAAGSDTITAGRPCRRTGPCDLVQVKVRCCIHACAGARHGSEQ